jgi:hypothetical protein
MLTCDTYANQTMGATLCAIASTEICEDFMIEPQFALGLAIDALATYLGVNLLQVPPADLIQVIQNANCGLKGQEGFQTISPLQQQAFLLYLVNQVACP